MENKYYIGLDVGTDSVGWAVTDESYNIKRFKGNAMWGVRLFDESNTAAERRSFRTARRRLDRRGDRLRWLEKIFAEEICKVDPEFFIRMKESPLHYEDKSVQGKYAIFAGSYTDKDYFKDYPTIYHLRRELIESSEPHDIRLVYLALHHIIKYRGHFLFEDLSAQEIEQFTPVFEALAQYCQDNYADDGDGLNLDCSNKPELEKILCDKKLGKRKKRDALAKLYGITSESDPQKHACLGLLSGCQEKLWVLFDDDSLKSAMVGENKLDSISFSSDYDSNAENYEIVLGERFELIQKLKAVYDWAVLADKLDGENYLSMAMVKKYLQHHEDLNTLKNYVRKYKKERYDEIFKLSETAATIKKKKKQAEKDSDSSEVKRLGALEALTKNAKKLNNYVAYSGSVKEKGKTGVLNATATQEEFCAYLKKILGTCKVPAKYADLFEKIENGTLCPKMRTAGNGTIPKQRHEMELNQILENAKGYLPFLTVKDEEGKTPAEKVQAIFNYKIPYYVGPLNKTEDKNNRAWLERDETRKITPWNIKDVVDFDTSAVKFIENLTNQCSYLPQETVLPKNSILYSKYMVLNAINAIKIDGHPITVAQKQDIFNELFLKKFSVKKKDIEYFLHSKDIEFSSLTGIDNNLGCSMKPYLDMQQFSGFTEGEKETIIKEMTIFGEQKKMLKDRLNKEFPGRLNEADFAYLAKRKYSGWGRLSEKFLTEIFGEDDVTGEVRVDNSTGEPLNIITALWQTNLNLMQLLYSKEYNFNKAIEKAAAEAAKESNDSLQEAVARLYVSPKIKRPINQALQIVQEIVKTQGCPPAKIFLEVARFEGDKNRTKSRKTQLQEIYAAFKKEYPAQWNAWRRDKDLEKELSDIQEERLRRDQIFLYFSQMGRCIYTDKGIDLGELIQGSKNWDIDHIYPQSKIKDDSLLNNRVLCDSEFNQKVKNDQYPIPASNLADRPAFWKMLLERKMITPEKYGRLVCRDELTEEQLSAFINRQLVETQQSTKAIAGLLKEMRKPWAEKYGSCDTDIVYVKAGLVSDFRQNKGRKKKRDDQKNDSFVKCRDVNDLHHAKDAYLNIVVGNVYDVQCRKNYQSFIKGLQDGSRSMNGIFTVRTPGAWEPGVTLATVEKYMAKNNILYTRYSFKNKGELFKQKPLKKGEGQVPQKATGPLSRKEDYGAYPEPRVYCFCLAKHGKPGKQKIGLYPVDLYRKSFYLEKPEEYLKEDHGLINPEILMKEVNIQSCLSFDGFRVHLSGKDGGGIKYRPGVQLVVSPEQERYIKNIYKFMENQAKNKAAKATSWDGLSVEQNQELYQILIDKMQNSIYKTVYSDLGSKLAKKRGAFDALSLEQQCSILKEIVKILQCNARLGELEAIGAGRDQGKILTRYTVGANKYTSVKLIHQSVTGLYEHEVELLNL